jgi:transcriptional regulator
MSVHAKGEITFLGGEELVKMLRMTSLHFENKNDESPTVYDNLPQEMMHRLMKAIVAFEIEVTEIDTVFKLSQDRDLASYKNIIQQLKQHDADSQVIAKEMEKRIDQLFKSS